MGRVGVSPPFSSLFEKTHVVASTVLSAPFILAPPTYNNNNKITWCFSSSRIECASIMPSFSNSLVVNSSIPCCICFSVAISNVGNCCSRWCNRLPVIGSLSAGDGFHWLLENPCSG